MSQPKKTVDTARPSPRAPAARRYALLAGVLAAVMLAVAYWVLAPGKISGADAGDPRLVGRGAAVYATHCASCHGKNLEGEPNWQTRKPTGELPAPPHDASGHTWHHPDPQLFAIVKQGGQPFMPAGMPSAMPAYDAVLADGDIWAALAFIKSRWPAEIQARQEQITRANQRR